MLKWRPIVGLGAALMILGAVGCRPRPVPTRPTGTVRVLCATYPVWLMTRSVTDGRSSVQTERLFAADLGCAHEHVMAPQDARRLASADVLIVNGLGLDDYASAAYRRVRPNGTIIVASRDVDRSLHWGGSSARQTSANPHLFASPWRYAAMARSVAASLGRYDPGGAAMYQRNARSLARRLEGLGDDFRTKLASMPNRRIITDHDVFDYLADDAGIEVAAVVRADPESDPGPSELIEIVRRAQRLHPAALFVEPGSGSRLGQTIAAEIGIPLAILDPVVQGPEDPEPDYYERAMRRNLRTLVHVLGRSGKP